MKSIIIIPARSGSKRLIGKNMRLIADRPLLDFSIEYALENKSYVDSILVSSDDDSILSYALDKGVEVHKRSEAFATDLSSTASVLKNIMEHINEVFDVVILLQPTNPFRPKNLLKEALCLFQDNKKVASSLITISAIEQKIGKLNGVSFKPLNYEFGQRSQDVDTHYYENGLLYITTVESILKEEVITKDNIAMIIDHNFATVDIDTIEDFEYAVYMHDKYIK